MPLKYKCKTKDEIPAEHLPLYAEREGAWVLDVDGAVEKSKLDEFRNTNVSLLKERDDLKQRFDGIDPEQARAALAERQRDEEDRLLKGGAAPHPGPLPKAEREKSEQEKTQERERLEKVIEGRIKSVRGELEKQNAALTTERDALTSRLTSIQIDQGVTTVATKRGLRPTAIPDITARARTVFRLVNGTPTAFEPDGKSVRYGRDGLTPMTLEEWVDAQVSEAPHLFESNAGGGGGGSTPGGNANRAPVKNPFRKETRNLTEQMKLLKTDPQLAARLKAAA